MSNINMDHPSPASPGTYATCAFDQAVQLASQGSKGRPRVTEREHLEVEELVLKRCWLARYWGLAARLGVYPAIAHKKHALWAGLAPLPNEVSVPQIKTPAKFDSVVISAGQKAKSLATEQRPLISISSPEVTTDLSPDHALSTSCENFREEEEEEEEEEQMRADGSEDGFMELVLQGEGNGIDSQLLVVEEGLRELAEMKVEQAVLLKISHNQNPALIWFGLSGEQVQDIRFKQAWLVYYWRRTHVAGMVEQDVAVERLLYWMDQTNKPTTYEDAVTVQRGLVELRSLGIDSWSRLMHIVCGASHDKQSSLLKKIDVKNFHEDTKQLDEEVG